MIGNPLLLSDEGYQISRSVRLRSSASAYLSRTAGTPTNANIWTLSGWVKRGTLSTRGTLLCGGSNNVNYIAFNDTGTTDYFGLTYANTPSQLVNVMTTQVFRDPSAWYHLMVVYDSTSATSTITGSSTDRVRLYVNGTQVTAFSATSGPSQNTSVNINAASAVLNIGRRNVTSADSYFDGYLTEVNFIDGQALTPASFGETDALTGVWKPKKYTGTYGTNGFYLNFSDNSSNTATTIGKDYSGNGNNWTPNNISVTSGATYDSMLDVPTLWADGGNGRGNYATLNPVSSLSSGITVSGGNLNFLGASASAYGSPATMLLTSGKWYFEVTAGSVASRYPVIGVQTESTAFLSSGFPGGYSANGFGYGSDGNKFVNNGAAASFGSTFTSGDVIGVAIDIDAGKVWLAKNNTWQASGDPAAGTNPAYSPTAGTALYPCVGTYNGAGTHSANFGQRPFTYTPPSGFKALNTGNLPEPVIKKGNQYFDVRTRAGTSTATTISGYAFAPDLVWIKIRSGTERHVINDTVRGAQKQLASNTTAAEDTSSTGALTAFTSDGYSLDSDLSRGSVNNSAYTYVDWAWKEGATPGFDIVTYTGTGSAQNISHSLGVTPAMMIVKARSLAGENWQVYHKNMAASPQTNQLLLNSTAAVQSATVWNNTAPTSSVFSVSGGGPVGSNGQTYVAYLFAEVAGFSRFGSYTGNGSTDGPFCFTGFRPRFVMVKRTDVADSWGMFDG